jgi:hypothetical protein
MGASPRPHASSCPFLRQLLQSLIARLHALIHAGVKHGFPCLRIGQCHAHGHQRARTVRLEAGFDMVVGCRVGQMHTLYVNDPAIRLDFKVFAGEIKPRPVAFGPFVADLPARLRIADADRHRPALGTEHPFLDQLRLGMGAEHGFRFGRKAPCDDDMGIALGLQRQFAHDLSFPSSFSISASTPSSRS